MELYTSAYPCRVWSHSVHQAQSLLVRLDWQQQQNHQQQEHCRQFCGSITLPQQSGEGVQLILSPPHCFSSPGSETLLLSHQQKPASPRDLFMQVLVRMTLSSDYIKPSGANPDCEELSALLDR